MRAQRLVPLALLALAFGLPAYAQQTGAKALAAGAKVFIAPMEDGFDEYLKAAIQKKKIPLVIVGDKAEAQFEMTGHSDTQKSTTSKKILLGKFHSDEQASIQVANLESGEVVFAYSVNKSNSAHGKQSTAEACAKHILEAIERKK